MWYPHIETHVNKSYFTVVHNCTTVGGADPKPKQTTLVRYYRIYQNAFFPEWKTVDENVITITERGIVQCFLLDCFIGQQEYTKLQNII